MKLFEEFEEYENLWEPLEEARSKQLPSPPNKLEIIKIEPKLQQPYDNPTRHFRHYDEITYVDPYSGRTKTATVWEEDPEFGNWFGWGSEHSEHWNYAAYSYEGNLLLGIDPTGHMSSAHKKAIERTVNEINNS